MSDEVELPSEEELAELPMYSKAVYAIRCALRVLPILVSWNKATDRYKAAVVELNRQYRILIYNAPYATERDSRTNTDIATNSAYVAARKHLTDSSETATNIVAALAAAAAARSATDAADSATYATYTTIYAKDAAKAFTRDTKDTKPSLYSSIDSTARSDYEKLKSIGKEVTDASETGPLGNLWPDSPPDWYVKAKERYDETIMEWEQELGEEYQTEGLVYWDERNELEYWGKENVLNNEIPLEFYLLRGNASEETVEEVFNAISNLSFAAGGFGLLFKNDGNAISIVPEEMVR